MLGVDGYRSLSKLCAQYIVRSLVVSARLFVCVCALLCCAAGLLPALLYSEVFIHSFSLSASNIIIFAHVSYICMDDVFQSVRLPPLIRVPPQIP